MTYNAQIEKPTAKALLKQIKDNIHLPGHCGLFDEVMNHNSMGLTPRQVMCITLSKMECHFQQVLAVHTTQGHADLMAIDAVQYELDKERANAPENARKLRFLLSMHFAEAVSIARNAHIENL